MGGDDVYLVPAVGGRQSSMKLCQVPKVGTALRPARDTYIIGSRIPRDSILPVKVATHMKKRIVNQVPTPGGGGPGAVVMVVMSEVALHLSR